MYSSAIVDDNYVVHLNVKHIQMPHYMEHILTIPISVDLNKVIHIKLENIHHEYMKHHGQLLHANATLPYTGILKVGTCRGLKPTVVKKHVTFNLPPLHEENKPRYYTPHILRRLKQTTKLERSKKSRSTYI